LDIVNDDLNNANTIPTVDENTNKTETVPSTEVQPTSSTAADNAEVVQVVESTSSNDVVSREDVSRLDVETNKVLVTADIGNKDAEEETNRKLTMEERRKQAEANYKPPSGFRIFLLVVFFILLIGFVLFLPEINSMVLKYKAGVYNNTAEEKITTGTLTCTLSSSTANLNLDYTGVFEFSKNQLDKMRITLVTRGDITLDEETLNELNSKCEILSAGVKEIEGISVSCDYTDGKLTEKQSFSLDNLDTSLVTSAYSEAGGNYPGYKYKQDIDDVEKNMNAEGYTCKREAN